MFERPMSLPNVSNDGVAIKWFVKKQQTGKYYYHFYLDCQHAYFFIKVIR